MAGRRAGAEEEFRCPVCHYLFPLSQKDHVQRCVRREMAQDPRIQRRMRSQTQQQRRATTSNGTTANNTEKPAGVTNNGNATKLPPIKLPSKGAKGVPAAAAKPAASKPKTTSLGNKSLTAPKLPGARAGSNQHQQSNNPNTHEPSISIGHGGYVITHQSKTKPREETKAQNRKSTSYASGLTTSNNLNGVGMPTAVLSSSPPQPTPVASSPPQSTVTPINLKKSKSKDKDLKKSKEKISKKSSKEDLKRSRSATKPNTPREFIDALSEKAAEKLPARVYSGMKQNEGTFWTFVINKTSTAIDLLDQVAAKCGIPVEQMALYAQTEKSGDVRIKDTDSVYILKLKWQNTNNNSKFLIKERAAGDSVARVQDSVTSPVTSPAMSPVMSPVVSPVTSPVSSPPSSPREEQQEQQEEQEEQGDSVEEEGDEQVICVLRSQLPTTAIGTLLHFLVGSTVKISELLAFIGNKHNLEAHTLGVYKYSPLHFNSRPTLVNPEDTVSSVLEKLTNMELLVKVREQSEGSATPAEIDVSNLDITEMDEETLLKEQWESRKQMVGNALTTMLISRPSAQQLMKSGVLKAVQV